MKTRIRIVRPKDTTPTSLNNQRRLEDTAHHDSPSILESHIHLLHDKRLPRHERQRIAAHIGRTQGNHHLQRVIQRQPSDPVLRLGSASPAVRTLQQYLTSLGENIVVDGIFGPKTQQAVIRFQQANGLTPDGIVGAMTWSRLKSGGGAPSGANPTSQQQVLINAKLQQIKTLLKTLNAQSQTNIEGSVPTIATEVGHSHDSDDEEESSWLDDVTSWASEKVESATDWANEQVGAATEWVGEQVDSATEWVEEQGGTAVEWVSEQANAATEWIGEQAGSVMEWAGETIDEVGNELSDLGDDIREFFDEEIKALEEVLRGIGKGLGFDDIMQKLDEILGGLSQAQQPVDETISGTADSATAEATVNTIGCDSKSQSKRVNLNLDFVSYDGQGQSQSFPVAYDSISGTLSFGSVITQNDAEIVKVPAKDFGSTGSKVSIQDIKFETSLLSDTVTVSAKVFVNISWAITQSPERTDISGTDDPNLTPDNWFQAYIDLDPERGKGYNGQPQRNQFWARDLTEIHEQYHAHDIENFARAYMAEAQKWFNSHDVDVPFLFTESAVSKQLFEIAKQLSTRVKDAINDHMGPPGEVRAYIAGRPAYERRAGEILEHAIQKGWPGTKKKH